LAPGFWTVVRVTDRGVVHPEKHLNTINDRVQ
jgi:hypothetical protein